MLCSPPSDQVGKITPEVLQGYVAATFGADAITVVGKGVNHEELTALVEQYFSAPGAHAVPSNKYYGGESVRFLFRVVLKGRQGCFCNCPHTDLCLCTLLSRVMRMVLPLPTC